MPIDIKALQEQAKKEIADERSKEAVKRLKDLYAKREKAALVLNNIDREIAGYLQEVEELAVYEAAGVDTTGDA